jgi:hypothetical protein
VQKEHIKKNTQNNKNNKYKTPSYTKNKFLIFKALHKQSSEPKSNDSK